MSKPASFLQFIFTKQFLIHLLLSVIVSIGIIYATLLLVDRYTLHGEEITVPDLRGLNRGEIKELLNEKQLKFKIVDSVFVLDKEKGVVLAQNPDSMSKVKEGRTIYITISSMSPPIVNLPLLTDKSMRQAKSIIENSGLALGELTFIPDLCMNCVLAQKFQGKKVTSDTIVPKGSKVDLVLGGGLSDEKVLVPWLHNMTKSQAIKTLKESFLNLGADLYDGTVFDKEDSTAARVYVQRPPYGEKSWVRMGSSVDIELTMLTSKIDSIRPKLDSSSFPKFEPDSLP